MAGQRECQQTEHEKVLVSAVALSNWEMQRGDPAVFAFQLAFLRNPHGDADRATPEERDSWGTFMVWARGENLCAHVEHGEILSAAHWYMLPFIEWLVGNWDALFHEERLPLSNVGLSAAESLALTKMPPLTLKEVDEFEWLDVWASWWSRHCLRAGSEGGLFPDLYIRRYRDRLELSTGAELPAGIPSEHIFLTPRRLYHVDLAMAAEAVFDVLDAAVHELRRRIPDSARINELAANVAGLSSPKRRDARMAWLAGWAHDIGAYKQIATMVDETLASAAGEVREQLTGTRWHTPLVVEGTAYARLLYGAISPNTTLDDVARLADLLIANYVPDASPWLASLDLPMELGDVMQLAPGEQGSWLGERASELLARDAAGWVDIHAVLNKLNVAVTKIDLTDDQLRAVSVFGPMQRPHIFCNRRTRWGQSSGVERFTLAHELCHLLLDREYGGELAVASGPWAPVAIEQRANAFAAAFLMPTWLLRAALASLDLPLDEPEGIAKVAGEIQVSASSLIDRLYNLGELTLDDRYRLRERWSAKS
jgi:Zn-dependent peptidase ImmA (M78 family)